MSRPAETFLVLLILLLAACGGELCLSGPGSCGTCLAPRLSVGGEERGADGSSEIGITAQKARSLALEAGEIMKAARIRAFSGRAGGMEQAVKADKTVVTQTDLEIQTLLDRELVRPVPGSVVVGEESYAGGSIIEKAAAADYVWVVDPIDGTKSFIDENETEFGVGITLLFRGNPVISIFYAPEWDIEQNGGGAFFAADAQSGRATLNGRALNPFAGKVGKRLVNVQMLGNTGFSGPLPGFRNIRYYKSSSFAGPYSLIARICSVAASGNLADVPAMFYSNPHPKIWDTFPAALILVNAGMTMVYDDGTPVFPFSFNDLRAEYLEKSPRTRRIIALSARAVADGLVFHEQLSIASAA